MNRVLLPIIFFLSAIWLPYISSAQDTCDEEIQSILLKADSLNAVRPTKALPLIKEVRPLVDSCGTKYYKAWYFESLGYNQFQVSEFLKAIESFEEAIKINRELKDTLYVYQSLAYIGDCYGSLGLTDKATEYYFKVIPYHKAVKDTYNLAATYINIGITHMDQKLYAKSEEYFTKALNLVKDNPRLKTTKADAIESIARVEMYLGNLFHGLELAAKAEKIYREENDHLGLAYCNQIKSNLYTKLGKLDTAFVFNQKAIEFGNQFGDPYLMASFYSDASEISLKKNNISKADSFLQMAEPLALETGSLALIEEIYDLKSDVLEMKKDFGGAFRALKKKVFYSDSLHQKDAEKRFLAHQMELEAKETERLQKENRVIEKENELKSLKLANRNYLLIFSGILLLAFIVFSVISYLNRRKIARLNKTKDRLISVISHDLRTPVYQIEQLIDIALSTTDNDILRKTKLSANNLRKTFDNLLFWSKSQLQGSKPEKKIVDLKKQITETINFHTISLEEKNITIETKNVEDVSFQFDPTQFQIVIRNLVSNAIKFSEKNSKIKFEASDDEDYAKIEVIDEGTGISQENLEKLFNEKIMFSTKGTVRESGSGLGLTLVYYFTRLNNAQIEVDSKEGKGSIFRLVVPKINYNRSNKKASRISNSEGFIELL